MTIDPKTVVVAERLCDVCGTAHINMYHGDFADMWVSGETLRLAAENLIIRLRGNLDAVSDPLQREPICNAITDVREFLGSEVVLQSCCTDVIDTLATRSSKQDASSSTLMKTETLEVLRLSLPKGREIPTHQTQCEITIHCLEGRIAFTVRGATHELVAGQLIGVAASDAHSLVSLEDSTVLITKVLLTRPIAT